MGIVVTGAYNIRGLRLRRPELVQLCQAAGFMLDESVCTYTSAVFAENVAGNSTKLQTARRLYIPIRAYFELDVELTNRLSHAYGERITPAVAWARIQNYGIRAWATGTTTNALPGGDAMFYGVDQVRTLKQRFREEGLIKRTVVQPVAMAGQLTIKRNIKL
jgi:hypothetical protein